MAMSRTITASHDTSRAAWSSRWNTPMSSNSMALAARNISGSAGRKLGSARGIGALLALRQRRRGIAGDGDLHAFDEVGDGRLHGPQEGIGIDPHPQHDGDHRREDGD